MFSGNSSFSSLSLLDDRLLLDLHNNEDSFGRWLDTDLHELVNSDAEEEFQQERDYEGWSSVFEDTLIPRENPNHRVPVASSYRNILLQQVQARPENRASHDEERTIPHENDILHGRGRLMRNHPGNVRFRKLIAARFREYSCISRKKAKTEFCRAFIAQMELRFLKSSIVNDVTVWEEMSSKEMRQKVAWSFRNITKKLKRLAER